MRALAGKMGLSSSSSVSAIEREDSNPEWANVERYLEGVSASLVDLAVALGEAIPEPEEEPQPPEAYLYRVADEAALVDRVTNQVVARLEAKALPRLSDETFEKVMERSEELLAKQLDEAIRRERPGA